MQNNHFDVVIIGAGAAGLMCAQLAASRGHKVLLLDHSSRLAEKIRISGGGRCNFTNLNTRSECFISQNKYFMTSALSRYAPQHFCELLDRYKIGYHEKTLGQLFCNEKSQAIIELLDFLCRENNVLRMMATQVKQIAYDNSDYILSTTRGEFKAPRLVIASGGLAIPQIGATGFGYQVAEQFALPIVTTAPALVPLTLSARDLHNFSALSGISFFCQSAIGKVSFQEMGLFTHRGLSGPAILQISSYWNSGVQLCLDLLPTKDFHSCLEAQRSSNKLLSNFLADFFSQRLADNLCRLQGLDIALSQISNKQIDQLVKTIHNFSVTPSGTEGYKKAEVTRGGVDTKYLSSKNMMAQNQDGLYFIGEVVDVTGHLGGFNFQWAWASAYAAATSF